MEREFNGKRARYTHELPLDAYFGDAVCLDIKVEDWGLIKPEHLEDAWTAPNIKPEELKGMVVVLRTGMHLKYDDSKDYYHYSCGCGREAGMWFAEVHAEMCGHGPAGPRPSAAYGDGQERPTQMNLPGNSGRPITEEYIEKFGIEAYAEFERAVFIKVFGMEKYRSVRATWRPPVSRGPGSRATSS